MNDYIGSNVFVRTVTSYFTGRLVGVRDGFLVLGEAAWVADTGRFSAALKAGTLAEVEPYPDEVLVALTAVVDVCLWPHALPRSVT